MQITGSEAMIVGKNIRRVITGHEFKNANHIRR